MKKFVSGIAETVVELGRDLMEVLKHGNPEEPDTDHVDQTRSVNLPDTSAYSEVRELTAFEKFGPLHPLNTSPMVREVERDR